MTLTVNGLTSIYNATANPNYETPTNPKFVKASYNSTTDRIFAMIYDDGNITVADSGVFTEAIGGQGLLTEYSNLDNTSGHNIRCHAPLGYNTGGVDLSSISVDSKGVPDTNDYFVLIHSDDSNMHHLAKITSIENADIAGDSFNFAPKLGNRVPKGTKFMLFKGPTIANSTNIIALTAGIKNSGFVAGSNSEYVCARPIWYFYDDKLDKTGELNHNTKYQMRLEQATSGSSITLPTSGDIVTFITVGDMNNRIIDSSKYSYMVKLRDELKIKDDPDTATSNESSVLGGTFTDYDDYNDCFINARRDSDDNYGALVLNGPTRYTYYKDSPMKNNLLNNVISSFVQESIEGKTGYAETKAIDNNRILGTKLKTNQDYRVKQSIGRGDLNEWIQVGEIDSYILTQSSIHKYTTQKFVYGEDIDVYFNEDEEIRIGDRVGIYEGASAEFSFLGDYSRLLTESEFTNTFDMTTLTNGTKIYRRTYSKKSNNILTTINFEDNNTDKLKVVLVSDAYQNTEVSVVASPAGVDDSYKLLYLDFKDNHYDTDKGIEYADGDFIILYEVFSGKIEKITKGIENGSSMITIGGRNTFDKLVNPIINKDALHSTDIIYSTDSPYLPLYILPKDSGGSTTITTTGTGFAKAVTFGHAITIADKTPLWTTTGLVGILDGAITSATTGTLVDNTRIKVVAETVYGESNKQIMLNKSLSSNNAITSSTDLSAAADKGFSFKDGVILAKSDGTEGTLLVGTSENTDSRAIGYSISRTDSLNLKDSVFALKDDIFGEPSSTVNTLIDFTVISVNEDSSTKIVKLAPYIPLTLGRSHDNFADTIESTFTTIGTTSSSEAINEGLFLIDNSDLTTFTVDYLAPIFIDGKFVGLFKELITRPESSMQSVFHLTVNTPLTDGWASGKPIQTLSSKLTHDLHLINGAHLHGNKTIGLLGPHNGYMIDFLTFDSSSYDSYTDKFGESIFRLFNLEKGNFSLLPPKLTGGFFGAGSIYTSAKSNFNYYASSYKGRNKVAYNKLGSSTSNKILPIEKRGFKPVIYSTGFGRILPNAASNVLLQYRKLNTSIISSATSWEVEEKLKNVHYNASRLFLFSNCDNSPYSSSRKDSIMNNAERNLEKYGLLSLKKPIKYDSGVEKESLKGNTTRITYLDSQYEHSSIISSNKTLSALKRFSVIRLTELVTDFFYNPIDPEQLDENYLQSPIDSYWSYNIEKVSNAAGNQVSIAAYSTLTGSSASVRESTITTILVGGSSNETPDNLVQGDYLVDITNNMVWATVKTTPTNHETDIYILRKAGTDNNSLPTGGLYKISKNHIPLSGKRKTAGKQDNSVAYTAGTADIRKHNPSKMLLFSKGHIFGKNSTFPDNAWHRVYGEPLLKYSDTEEVGAIGPLVFTNDDSYSFLVEEITQNCTTNTGVGSAQSLAVQDSTVLSVGDYIKGGAANAIGIPAFNYITEIPSTTTVVLRYAATGVGTGSVTFITKSAHTSNHLHSLFEQYDLGTIEAKSQLPANMSNLSAHKIQVLKGFRVEGNINTAEAGQTKALKSLTLDFIDDGRDVVFPLYNGAQWGLYKDGGTFTASNHQLGAVSGAYAGFKFEINSADSDIASPTTRAAVRDKTYQSYQIHHRGKYGFLQFLDLTGCYLVPLVGTDDDGTSITSGAKTESLHLLSGTVPIYVVSHDYDTVTSVTDDKDYSNLILDSALVANTKYKIMQPSSVCFWPNSPTNIKFNHLSRKYTKMPHSENMYSDVKDFSYANGTVADRASETLTDSNEGIQSMYLVVDVDDRGANANVVCRDVSDLDNIIATTSNSFSGEMCISDGENNVVGGVELGKQYEAPSHHFMRFDGGQKLLGVVSCSETFELKVNGNITEDAQRAMIGTNLDISKESEALVEELFKENSVPFSLVPSSYPIYTTPDFQGTSLYILAKYLLSLKDKTMFDNAGTITVVEENSSTLMSKFEFDDSNILEYELVDSGFDFYNEIILYGSSNKSVRKNIRSINELGKKTLEVFDKKLTTQTEVDKRAGELLKIHNTETTNLEIKTHIRFAQTISSGDIVSVIINQENIERNLYMVLEMKYEISGQTTLLLGKYSKSIEDRFAEILLANKQTDSYIRRKDYIENENAFDFFEDIKIKEINLVIRKRTATGGTLGFASTLNIGTTTLGFGSGVSHAVLLEEDL